MPKKLSEEIVLNGISASPGICIGKAYLVDKEGVDVVQKYAIDPTDLNAEINRFKTAVKAVTDELHAIIENTPETFREHAYILETHLVLLKDKMLYGKTIETIKRDRVNAEWALKEVVSDIKSVFQNISDPYIKERSEDIDQVSTPVRHCIIRSDTWSISSERSLIYGSEIF